MTMPGDERAARGGERARGLLSDDAKGLAGCIWGIGIGEGTILKFGMQETRPTERCQAALAELVSAGFLWREETTNGAVSYRPLGPSMRKFHKFAKLAKFPIAEPLP